MGSSRNDWNTDHLLGLGLARPSLVQPGDRISLSPLLGESETSQQTEQGWTLPEPDAPTSASVSPVLTCGSIRFKGW